MDVHVPWPITHGLRERGVEVLTAQEDGSERLEDPDLLDRAAILGRVLFSQDEDLLVEANRRQHEGIPFVGVIYAPQLGLTIREFIDDLEIIGKAGVSADFENRVIYLPLRKASNS